MLKCDDCSNEYNKLKNLNGSWICYYCEHKKKPPGVPTYVSQADTTKKILVPTFP